LKANFTNRSAMKSDSNRDLHAAAAVPRDQNAAGQEVAATTEVRHEAVKRAQELIANPNYPDAAVIQKVADHLANHLQTPPADK
jgi:hypothetical protein